MALFESCDRRMDRINGVLAEHGVASTEQAMGNNPMAGAAVAVGVKEALC